MAITRTGRGPIDTSARAVLITSDIHGLERVAGPDTQVRVFSSTSYPGKWIRRLRLLLSAWRSDHLVVHFSLPDVLFFTALLRILPGHHCRLTTLDFFVGDLTGTRRHVIRWSLRRVHRFLVYFKDSAVFERMFDLPASRFRYVPFKINARDLIANAAISDEGYVFCGGRSRRDFATLFAAVEPLGYPVKVITSTETELTPHGSSLAGVAVPANVQIITHDPSPEFFIRTMAAARIAVVPIVPDSTTQAGIGVYLQAMALHKCVIVSTSLGVSDVLAGDEAIIVPAGDVDALREAIERVWNDQALRERYAQAGFAYASPLGGEDELRRSVLAALP
jgi:glycosyltransferase involved in cell wall biosynthesis